MPSICSLAIDHRSLRDSLRKANLPRLLARRVDGIFIAESEQGDIGPDLFASSTRPLVRVSVDDNSRIYITLPTQYVVQELIALKEEYPTTGLRDWLLAVDTRTAFGHDVHPCRCERCRLCEVYGAFLRRLFPRTVLSGDLHASVSIALVMPERGGKCTRGSVGGRVVVFGAILSRQFGDRRRDPVGCAFLRARAVLEGDVQSGLLVTKIIERRGLMLGLHAQ
jgi:hypothetical protein